MSEGWRIFETAAGFAAVAWSGRGVSRFGLPEPDPAAAERAIRRRAPGLAETEPSAAALKAIEGARRYFRGEGAEFADVGLDLCGLEPFRARVYAALRSVGWGKTTSYGALAAAIGAGPEAARAVGRAMAANPLPLIVPCHRVLAAGGRPGGFSGPGGVTSKVRMLALEGVDLAPAQGVLAL